MLAYRLVLVLKFMAVVAFSGGVGAALLTPDAKTRKDAVHRVVSPALLVTWLSGYGLLALGRWPLFDLWVVGSVLLSFIVNSALAYCAARDKRGAGAVLAVLAPLAGIVVLMVLKPTWRQVLS